ncbi:glutamine synthetase [Erysipelotrichaceae bacterium AF15-26LB]|nr:glutamine synthetase family protein [[Clostridium] innocuum]RJV91754.1 glutamine synthetase [Erysipelotrichaceae bacterium AF19-24AC]RJV92935.1 glutamine synthetase [Erysipelotrichaceae bacterium AF15-26LB]
MVTSEREIMEFIEEYDVKFIRLAFFDLLGNQKNISIMPQELEQVFAHGLSFDASAISGFTLCSATAGSHTSDLFLFPDISTLTILPWRPQIGRVVRMYCEIRYPDGSIFELDARSLLNRLMKQVRKQGYQIMAGTECEFYLFERDENGRPTLIPYDEAGYCDIAPLDKGENVRREICLDLEEMGILPERSHHEQGPGQNEIDFRFDEVVTCADNLMSFRNVVDMVALSNGLKANFQPKPLQQKPGNGLHINLSLFKNGSNLFAQDNGRYMEAFTAGILRRIREITIFLNPEKESYLRLGEDKAPCYICYSRSNRSALIRIPAAEERRTRIEVRSPDPSCNPYLALALLLCAGLEGMEEQLHVSAVDENVYLHHEGLQKLPASLKEAIELARNSSFIKKVLGEHLLQEFLKIKEAGSCCTDNNI